MSAYDGKPHGWAYRRWIGGREGYPSDWMWSAGSVGWTKDQATDFARDHEGGEIAPAWVNCRVPDSPLDVHDILERAEDLQLDAGFQCANWDEPCIATHDREAALDLQRRLDTVWREWLAEQTTSLVYVDEDAKEEV